MKSKVYDVKVVTDTFLIRTLCSVPLESVLERFNCIAIFSMFQALKVGGERKMRASEGKTRGTKASSCLFLARPCFSLSANNREPGTCYVLLYHQPKTERVGKVVTTFPTMCLKFRNQVYGPIFIISIKVKARTPQENCVINLINHWSFIPLGFDRVLFVFQSKQAKLPSNVIQPRHCDIYRHKKPFISFNSISKHRILSPLIPPTLKVASDINYFAT